MKKNLSLQIEVLCAVLVLLCTATLVIQGFGVSRTLSAHSADVNEAVSACQSVAELFAATGAPQALADALDKAGYPVQSRQENGTLLCALPGQARDGHDHTLMISFSGASAPGELLHADICMMCRGNVVYSLQTAKYMPLAAKGGPA